MRILVAEDDPISRLMLETTLKKWAYDVVVTSNGQEAWEALQEKENPPQLAILDWMNYWQQVEGYISANSEVRFSHSVCPDCYETIVRPRIDRFVSDEKP